MLENLQDLAAHESDRCAAGRTKNVRAGEIMRQDSNQRLLGLLKKYVPKGCIEEQGHIPAKGKGSWYEDVQGKRYLDFSSGIFTNTFGHGCSRLNHAGYEQAELLSNIHGRHSKAELLFYERLFVHLPAEDYKAIPYNDGGYTIDRGLTDIVNYYNKRRIAIGAYRGGFHGKTQAAKLLIHETGQASFYENFLMDFPNCYRCPWNRQKADCGMECVQDNCRLLEQKQARAVIFEPVQGAGIIIPPAGYWSRMEDFCKKHGILMFADEVLTGGGRTGCYLACSHFGIVPDMLALTKGLANGKPLSVLLEREYITENHFAVRPKERASTFAAHPEALAVAAELLKMLEEAQVLDNVKNCGELLSQGLSQLSEHFPIIGDVRSLGLMAAIEFVKDRRTKEPFPELGIRVFDQCRENGLEIIESGHIVRLAPPLNITQSDLQLGIRILEQSIAKAAALL